MPTKPFKPPKFFGIFLLITFFCAIATVNCPAAGPDFTAIKAERQKIRDEMQKKMKDKVKGEVQDKMSGMPQAALDAQSKEKVTMPPLDEAIALAQQAADEEAASLIDYDFHKKGKVIIVPDDHKSIQAAIDAAAAGDVIMVKAGVYYEQLIMKNGIKLVSDSSDNGDELVDVPGAKLKLPRRALRTIIDGSNAKPSKHGMIDFDPGITRKTIIDGFTVQNLPPQDHHVPGHAHGLNVRGASPVIMNCLINNMGSTGIGSHVVYNDQESPITTRDFRHANIKHFASAVIYHNIVHDSLGLGIGCNHFSSPSILGNEVFNNSDAALGEGPSPGIGSKHGSFATMIGNIVHGNPGGGILAQKGVKQGKHAVDRPTHPTVMKNVIYDNGEKRPAITGQHAGSTEMPLVIIGNFVYTTGTTAIGISDKAVGIIENNLINNGKDPAIAVNASTALKLNHNKVGGKKETPGIIIVNGGVVEEMIGNSVDIGKDTPRFLVDKDSVVKVKGH